MSKRIKRSIRKLIAKTLVLSLLFSFGAPKESNACDAAVAEAVMETAKEVSVVCPPAGPVAIGVAAVIITGVTVYGKCCTRSTNEELSIYYTLGHLPSYWRPNSVMDKINPNGKVIQRRVFGPDGRAKLDIDLSHHGSKKYHPWTKDGRYVHAHDHVYGKNHIEYQEGYRKPGREVTDQEYQRYIKDIDKININRRYRMRVEDKDEQNFVNKK